MKNKRHPFKTALVICLFAAFSVFGSLQGATLLKYNFSGSNPWPAMLGYASVAGGSSTATPAWTTVGTIDTYATTGVVSSTASSGIQLLVNSSAASGAWTAGVNSGILALSASNSITNLGLITLAFSLQSSTAHPIQVRLESYDAGNNRTGGLTTLIYPSAAGFYQRFAVDLSTMTADGAGTFNPTNPNLRISFEIGSALGGDGWPVGNAHELRIDNVNYSTPKYYVKNASPGSDANNGLAESTPYKTPNKALGLASPGDIIALMGTDTSADWFTGSSVNLTRPGAPEAWVVLKNYPGQQPIIRYDTWNVININGTNTLATNPCYVELRGLTVRGYSALDANGDRTLLPATSAATIGQANGLSNCNGISALGRGFTYKPHNIRLADSVVEYNAGGGVSGIEADRMSIENCVIRYNCWWMIYAGSGMSFLSPQNTESGTSYRMLVQGNEVYGNECMLPWYKIQAFSDGNGIILDTYSLYSFSGRTLVQNNLSYYNGGSGIHSYSSNSVDIIHNTAYYNSASTHLLYAQIFDSSSTDTRILNNVMVIPANPTGDSTFNERITTTSGGSTNFIQNNVLYAEGAFLANPTGANFTPNLTTNPQFLLPSVDPAVNDFQLHFASPAQNNSQILSYRAGRDFAFRPRFVDAADDRGAYQGQTSDAWAPMFSVSPGNYLAAQTVALSSTTAGATIYYTTNYTAPTTGSASVPSGGTVVIDATATLRAFAASSVYLNSTESSGVYTIQVAQPPSGVAIFGSGTPTGTATIAAPSNPANLLLNPGFENGSNPSPWAILGNGASGGSVNTTSPHTGSYGAHLTTPSAGFSQYVNLKLGTSYLMTGWGLKSVTSTNTYVSVNGAGSSSLTANYTANGGVWQQLSIPFTTSAGTGAVSVQVIPWLSSGSAGNVTLDDFALYETIPAGAAYELGTRFICSRYGQITSLRVWHPVGGPSSYNLNLWDASGTLLASTSASSDGTAGWVEGVLPTPVNVAEGAGVVVSYAVPSGSNYQATAGGLVSAITSGPVSTVVGNNGVYAAAAGVFPALSSGNTNYWTDARVNPVNSPAAPSGVVRARFTDGAGSAAPQQFPGSGGDGWVGGWSSSAAVSAASASVSPLQTTTNGYLQVARTGGTSSQEGVYRQWSTDTRPNNQFTRLTFDVRLDSSASVFNSWADNITVAARATPGAGTGSDTTFFIRAHGAAAGSLQAREWGVFNGQPGQTDVYDVNRLLPTGMIIQPGVTYSFVVDMYATDSAGNTGGRINGTYDVTITDGTNTARISGAGFLSAAYQSGSYLCFSSQQGSATDNLTFSVDSIEMTGLVPAALPPISVWRAAYFNPPDLANPALETSVWGDLADSDHDGINNLLEYALDTNPLTAATVGQPVAGRDAGGRLTLTFLCARSELTYLVEASSDLNVWTTLATNPGTVGDAVTVTDDPDGSSSTRFLRLRIVR